MDRGWRLPPTVFHRLSQMAENRIRQSPRTAAHIDDALSLSLLHLNDHLQESPKSVFERFLRRELVSRPRTVNLEDKSVIRSGKCKVRSVSA